jgi:septum formation protein
MALHKDKLILASASPRRLELLAQIGITPAKIVSPDIDETPHKNELPLVYAERVARAKALCVQNIHPDALILAADTVVYCGRRILPKAETMEDAKRCLTHLSGRRHRVTTAVAIAQNETVKLKLVTTIVRFKRLTPQELDAYLTSEEWQGKAGGYAIQGRASAFIPAINGSYSNVVGLPLAETAGMLANL